MKGKNGIMRLNSLKISIAKINKRKYTKAASQNEPTHTRLKENQLSDFLSRNLPAIYDKDQNKKIIKYWVLYTESMAFHPLIKI